MRISRGPKVSRASVPQSTANCDFLCKYVYNPPEGAQNYSQERNLDPGTSKSASRPKRVAKNDLLQNPSGNATFSRFGTVRQTLRPAMNESSAGRFWLTFSTKHFNLSKLMRPGCLRSIAARDFRRKNKQYFASQPNPRAPAGVRQELQTVFQQEHAAYDRSFANLHQPRRNGRSPGRSAAALPSKHPKGRADAERQCQTTSILLLRNSYSEKRARPVLPDLLDPELPEIENLGRK